MGLGRENLPVFEMTFAHTLRIGALAPVALLLATDVAAAQGGALQFDGIEDVCAVPDNQNDFDMITDITLEAWVQADAANPGGSFVGGQTPGGGGAYTLGGGIGNPTSGIMSVSTPGTDAVSAPNAINPGPTWFHVAGTFDGTNLAIYIDGAQVAASVHSSPGTLSSVERLIMGRFPVSGATLFFAGALDEVRVWNVVRTPAEIMGSYQLELSGNEPGLVGYYKFDETSGDVIIDSSSRGNDGFLGLALGAGSDDPTRIPSGAPIGGGSLGTNYCMAATNSTGQTGAISATGSALVGANTVTLNAANLPANQFGIFVVAQTQGFVVGAGGTSNGNLCLSGTLGRYSMPSQILTTGSSGTISLGIDLSAIPIGGSFVAAAPGDTFNFQAWHRDPVGLGSNFTDGVEITFQ